jgi:RHS repeat-associated protein
MGARYYIPWLCRWMATDPINNEYYNLIHGEPGRNHEWQHVELTASNYEYCYDNPVRFTDPSGEQAPTKDNPPVNAADPIEMEGVTITAQRNEAPDKTTTREKVDSFLKGFLIGAAITLVVVAAVAFTGGLGLAVGGVAVSSIISATAGTVGTVSLGISAKELITGKDLSGKKISEKDKWEIRGGIVGGLLV